MRRKIKMLFCLRQAPAAGAGGGLVFSISENYNADMDVIIKFSKTAFKHDISEADIRMAFDNVIYDERLDDSDEEEDIDARYLLIGFDRNANLLEILYNVIDENTLKVFHAMKCRNIYLPLLSTRSK
jgi:uncharacterized DUF497 family protein